MARKYGKTSEEEVEKEMKSFKKGTAHSGKKLKPVKSRKQAIAIGLSKARKKGAKVPKKPTGIKLKKITVKKKSITKKKTTGAAKKRTGTKKKKLAIM